MRICFVVHTFDKTDRGGVLRVVSQLANLLCEDYTIEVISLGNINENSYILDPKVNLTTLGLYKHNTVSYRGLNKIKWFKNAYHKVKPILNEETIWITSSPPISLLFALLKLNNKKIKVIGCDHTSTVYQKNYFIQKIRNKLLSLLNVMVGLNPQDQEYYFRNGINAVCIPNGIDLKSIKKINNKNKYLVFVGRFSDEKQPLKVIELFVNSKLFKTDVILKMYGHGDLNSAILEYIKNHRYDEKIKVITGEIDPDVFYTDAMALILTSKIEGFGIVLLEAMAREVPCLSFKTPYGPLNIIKNNINGFFIEDCVDDFNEKIDRLQNIDRGSIYKTIVEYSEESIVIKWKELIEEIRIKDNEI